MHSYSTVHEIFCKPAHPRGEKGLEFYTPPRKLPGRRVAAFVWALRQVKINCPGLPVILLRPSMYRYLEITREVRAGKIYSCGKVGEQ